MRTTGSSLLIASASSGFVGSRACSAARIASTQASRDSGTSGSPSEPPTSEHAPSESSEEQRKVGARARRNPRRMDVIRGIVGLRLRELESGGGVGAAQLVDRVDRFRQTV